MNALKDGLTLLMITLLLGAVAGLVAFWPFGSTAQGGLRCEGKGAVVMRVAGKDYAVNGMASSRYPPIQDAWNREAQPHADIDRLIVRGLTLCSW